MNSILFSEYRPPLRSKKTRSTDGIFNALAVNFTIAKDIEFNQLIDSASHFDIEILQTVEVILYAPYNLVHES